MSDAQRLAELPTYSRMAWSARPVWDRRAPQRDGQSHQSSLGRAGRGGNRYRADRRSHRRAHLLASEKPLVTKSELVGGRDG